MEKNLLTTRRGALAGLASLGGLLLQSCNRPLPPSYGNILRMGDAFTYAAHRTLLSGQSLVKEYSYRDISSFPATGTTNPADSKSQFYSADYEKLMKNNFADYRLKIEGLVARPGAYSMQDLQRLPVRKQITKHFCEEGWSAIGEWIGVQMSQVLNAVGILPEARFVQVFAFDGYSDNLDMIDAYHPQTILAYGMNGKNLPIPHGAPLRLRVENQVGYKSMKYVNRLVLTDKFDDFGANGSIQNGWAWYVGI